MTLHPAGFPFTNDREADANDWWVKFESARGAGAGAGAGAGTGGTGAGSPTNSSASPPSASWIDAEVAAEADNRFSAIYDQCYTARMQLRLGIKPTTKKSGGDSDGVVDGWVQWLKLTGADYPLASRMLAEVDLCAAVDADDDDGESGSENDAALAAAAQSIAEAGGVASAAASGPEQGLLVETLRLLQSRICPSGKLKGGKCFAAFQSWSQTIRAAVPKSTLRSFHVRQLLTQVADDPTGESDGVVRELFDALQRPFGLTPWQRRGGGSNKDGGDETGSSDGGGDGDGGGKDIHGTCASSIDGSAADGCTDASQSSPSMVVAGLQSQPAAIQSSIQTSCGGQ